MNRQNVYDLSPYGRTLVGWYDRDRAESYDEGTRWDGSNTISLATDSQWHHETLWVTAKGRYVLERWGGDEVTHEYISPLDSQKWLIRNEYDNEIIERAMGQTPADEAGPAGRPPVGPAVKVRLPEDLLARIDELADAEGVTRAEWMRQTLESALTPEGGRPI